jgi:hypothetical protein
MILYSKQGIPKYYSSTYLDIQNINVINYEKVEHRTGEASFGSCIITYMEFNDTMKPRKEKINIDLESYKQLVTHVESVCGNIPSKKTLVPRAVDSTSDADTSRSLIV